MISVAMIAVASAGLAPLPTESTAESMAQLGVEGGEAEQVRAMVAEVMAEAQTRSSLLGAGASGRGGDAGHDGRFYIAGDGFRLQLSGTMQTRYQVNIRDDGEPDDVSNGFDLVRLRLNFGGTIDGGWSYLFQLDVSGNNLSSRAVAPQDAWIARTIGKIGGQEITVYAGQAKPPVVREDVVVDTRQLAVERALSTDLLRVDRSKGIGLTTAGERWRSYWTLNSGINTDNTQFNASSNSDYAFSGRVEWLAVGGAAGAGGFKAFDDYTSARGSELAVMVGLGGLYQSEHNTGDPTDVDQRVGMYSADVGVEGDGWNASAAFTGRHVERDSLSTETANDDFGVVVQGGIRVTALAEVFARYDLLVLGDEGRPSITEDSYTFITAGMNYYFAGHALKLTADVMYSVDATAGLRTIGVLPSVRQGLLGDAEEGETAVRVQMQMLF